jgi:NAD(P)H-hydrate repair Nnr-like enzyme with NAD(P)H-hydrate epimerase domain
MRKVFSNCYAMDQRCYDEYGLTEEILMEHAAQGMESYIRHNVDHA